MRLDATAILLAGGQSTRMGRDKAMLPWCGVPLIQHVHAQLSESFREVVIASGSASRYAQLGLGGVADSPDAEGPMAGILAALEAAAHPICFLHPCDVPEIDFQVVLRLFEALSPAHDAAALLEQGRIQPLGALCRRDAALEAFRACAAQRNFAIHAALASLRVATVEAAGRIPNLNTPEDFIAAGGALPGNS